MTDGFFWYFLNLLFGGLFPNKHDLRKCKSKKQASLPTQLKKYKLVKKRKQNQIFKFTHKKQTDLKQIFLEKHRF